MNKSRITVAPEKKFRKFKMKQSSYSYSWRYLKGIAFIKLDDAIKKEQQKTMNIKKNEERP